MQSADGNHRRRRAAALAFFAAIAYIAVGLSGPSLIPVAVGLAALGMAAGLWRGSDTALVLALVAGPLAILPALFGAWGLTVVAEDWFSCADRNFAAMVASSDDGATISPGSLWRSLPPDYCQRVNWVSQWGVGLGLAAGGIAAMLMSVLLFVGPIGHASGTESDQADTRPR